MTTQVATFSIAVLTILLVLVRPKGWPEAIWSSLGAILLVATGIVSLADAKHVLYAASEPLLFLAALLMLAALLECSGFFEWAALHAARASAGHGRALYRNVFLLGAAVTAILSLDTTAVILTPIVLAVVRRLDLPSRPFIFACAFVANIASLPLPVSNLTNLLFASALDADFASFAARLALPNLFAVCACYALCTRAFRAVLPERFAYDTLPEPASVIPHRGYFLSAATVLVAVCVGYFVAPVVRLPPYVFGFAGVGVLLLIGAFARRVDRKLLHAIPWNVFPFVVGLFIVLSAVEEAGVRELAKDAFSSMPDAPWLAVPASAALTTVMSNLANNLPAALLSRDALVAAGAVPVRTYGALLGTNIGPNILVTGSLATMLVLERAREHGAAPTALEFAKVGVWVTPLVMVAAALPLVVSFFLFP